MCLLQFGFLRVYAWEWDCWCFWKEWCWSWNSSTLATWFEELTHLKRPWCWEWLRAGGEGDDRGWDGWMASPLNGHGFGWTLGAGDGQGGLVCFMGSQRVGHDWATELNWTYTLALLQFSFKTTPSMIQPICELDHASVLLRTIQWFLFYFWIKYRSLTVAYKDIHILAPSLVSVPPLSPCSSCKCLLVLTISQPFKFLLWERSLPQSCEAYLLKFLLFTVLSQGRCSLIAQSVKNLPHRQETQVQFLGQEDPLEKEMANNPRIPAWGILWTEETGRLHGGLKSRRRLGNWTATAAITRGCGCVVLGRGDTLRPRAEEPQQGGRRHEITFRVKPHTCQRCSEGSNIPCAHQDPETPQRLSQNSVWVSPVRVWVSSGLPQGQRLWV